MAIENRNLAAGAKLVAIYKGQRHECVYDGEAFVYAGAPYSSPSKAGSVVTGGTSVNGWKFWTPEGEVVEKEPRGPKAPGGRGGSIAERSKTVRFIKAMKVQDGVAEGFVKYWCSSCMNSFIVAKGEPHDTCPAGHADRYEDEFAGVPAEALKEE